MTYHITKIVKGDVSRLHTGIKTLDQARDILKSMADHYKRGRNKIKLLRWGLVVNDNEIVYQIVGGE